MGNKKRAIAQGIGIFLIAAIFSAGFSVIAYNMGNQSGWDIGHGIGYNEGHGIGWSTGYEIGLENGRPVAFSTVTELRKWLNHDDTDKGKYIDTIHDCDDFAMDLVNAANEEGYIMYTYTEITFDWGLVEYYYTIYGIEYILFRDYQAVLDSVSGHAYNFVVIDGDIWFIEPQTDEIFYGGREL